MASDDSGADRMNHGDRRRVELILPMRTVLLVLAALGLAVAFSAIGDTFLIVFVGIFLGLVFEYPVRFVMAKTHMSRGLAATVTVSGPRSLVTLLMLLLLVPLVGQRARLPPGPSADGRTAPRAPTSSPRSATPAPPGTCRTERRADLRVGARTRSAACSASPASSSGVFLAAFTIIFICLFLLTDVVQSQAGARRAC